MNQLLFYLLQVIAASGLLYGYYHFALRNKKFHRYNRFYLLMAVVISSLIPFLNIPVYFSANETESSIVLQTLQVISSPAVEETITPALQTEPVASIWFNAERLVYLFYVLFILFFLIRVFISLNKIRSIIKKNAAEQIDKIKFINTDEPGTPFSFFRWLFWNRKIELHSEKGEQIFRHELFHIQQKHSWDIIFMEFISTIFWINPFSHLIKKEIKTIHEFLADEFAIKENKNWQYAELLLMQAFNTNNHLVNPFFHNQIKRRIAMITTSTKPSYQYLRKLMVLPVATIIIFLFAFSYQTTQKDQQELKNARLQSLISKNNADTTRPLDDRIKEYDKYLVVIDGVIQPQRGLKNIDSTLILKNGLIGSIEVYIDKHGERKYGESGQYGVIEIRTQDHQYPDSLPRIKNVTLEPPQKNVTDDKLKSWEDRKMYGIWVDDNWISNGELKEYMPSDFAWYDVKKVEPSAVDYGKYKYRVNLVTKRYNDKQNTLTKNGSEVSVKENWLTDTTKPKKDEPLIVIDGKLTTDLTVISPNDIEKISVLKGKNATDKYGEKAKNGVIEISTKKITVREITLTEKKYEVIDDNKVFEKVEVEAAFRGGVKEWRNYLNRNLDVNVPVKNGSKPGTYTVIVQFIVEKDGNVSDVRALTNHGFGMEEEAIRMIKEGPDWLPAIQNGHNVKAYRKQPFTFVIVNPKISISRYSDAPIYAYLINSMEGATINLTDLKKVNQLKLQKKDPVQNCELVSFKITIDKPNSGNAIKKAKDFVITGNSFSSELLKAIDDLDAEAVVILEDIDIKIDNQKKRLPPRIYEVKSTTTPPNKVTTFLPLEKVRSIQPQTTTLSGIESLFGLPASKTIGNNEIYWKYTRGSTQLDILFERSTERVTNFHFAAIINPVKRNVDYDKVKSIKQGQSTLAELEKMYGLPYKLEIDNNNESWYYEGHISRLAVLSTNRKSGVISDLRYY